MKLSGQNGAYQLSQPPFKEMDGSPPTSIQVIGQNYIIQSLLTVREPRQSILVGHIPGVKQNQEVWCTG